MTLYKNSAGGQPTLRPTLASDGRPPANATDTTEQKKARLVKRVASIRTRTNKAPRPQRPVLGSPLKPERSTFGPAR